jgi:hypothetical protein
MKRSTLMLIGGCAAFFTLAALTNQPTLAGTSLDQHLERRGDNYDPDPAMLSHTFDGGTGYHTTLEAGTTVHPTRNSADYALALVARGQAEDLERAERVFEAVMDLQDTDPDSDTYGIWPYFREESLEEMEPPDWNWADFIGMRLAIALKRWPDRLPDQLRQRMRTSLEHAAKAIRRRDVGPGYTNIAVLGGGVCVVAGELLENDSLLSYGRQRLKGVVEHTEHHGSFNEYNSPTYTCVVLEEAERTMRLAEDPEAVEAADQLRRMAWQVIADSWHPATQQWAGPHSRTYGDRLGSSERRQILARVRPEYGPELPIVETSFVQPLPCPEELRQRFDRLPEDPLTLERTFLKAGSPRHERVGMTWLTREATIGSINRASFWTQRRPMIGYWQTRGQPAVLRARFLKDGKDFASVGLASAQRDQRVLSALYTFGNRGDWHIHLDSPDDGVFPAEDLRLRYQVEGPDVQARQLDEHRYELKSGDWRAVMTTSSGQFDGEPIEWKTGEEDGLAYVEAVCHTGAKKNFDFQDLAAVEVAAGVELLSAQAEPTHTPLEVTSEESEVTATWNGLEVTTPAHVP